MNKVILYGNLVRDIEVKDISDSFKVGRSAIAVRRNFKNKEGSYDSDFIQLTFGGRTVDFASKYFKKGSPCIITGWIRTGSYDRDGVTVYTTEVSVDEIYFTSGGKDNNAPAKKYEDVPDDFPAPDNDATGSLPFDL